MDVKLTFNVTVLSSHEDVLIIVLFQNWLIGINGGLLEERGRSKYWSIPTDKHFCKRHARQGGKTAEKYLRVVSI